MAEQAPSPGFSSRQVVCSWGQEKKKKKNGVCASLCIKREFPSIDQKSSSIGQGHPLKEPYHLKHFLLQGNQFRPNAELAAVLKFTQRGVLAPEAFWAIKSVMAQRPLGSWLPSLLC